MTSQPKISKQDTPEIQEDSTQIQDESPQVPDESPSATAKKAHYADSKHIILAGLLIVGLFFGLGGAWVTFTKITGAVIAQGEVRVDTERKTVAHLEGGIVHEILVRNGDKVRQGDTLVVLESARVMASTDQILLQQAAALFEEARLIAARDFMDKPLWPEGYPEVTAKKIEEMRASGETVFVSNRRALQNQTNLLRKQIDQLHIQIKSIDDQLEAGAQVVEALQEELSAKQSLYDRQYIEKTQILELKRALADRRGSFAKLRGAQAELLERIAEFELRIQTLRSEYRQKAITRLAEVQKTLNDLQQQLLPLKDARRRLKVTAPVSGEVVAMQVHSIGGVVKAGQPILDIVPEESPLIVECNIQVKDIVHLFKGQEADVELLAFPVRTTPKITAKVVYISADRLLKQTPYGEKPTYVVHVELDKQELEENNVYLSAGMPAAVYIKTKPRTVLDYALEPLTRNFDRALREN